MPHPVPLHPHLSRTLGLLRPRWLDATLFKLAGSFWDARQVGRDANFLDERRAWHLGVIFSFKLSADPCRARRWTLEARPGKLNFRTVTLNRRSLRHLGTPPAAAGEALSSAKRLARWLLFEAPQQL